MKNQTLVIDASMALSWIFERSDPKEISCSVTVLNALDKLEIFVPVLWHMEIANVLLLGERRKIINEAKIIDYLSRLSDLPFNTDYTSLPKRLNFIMALAKEHELTAYDATYLDLALRLNASLATFDRKLAKAMKCAGGMLFEG